MRIPDTVIALLYDRREGWWGLDELARAAGVGPGRLDGALAELRGRGHDIQFHPTTGLRLGRPAALDAHLIERDLGTRRIGRHVICFPVVDSTNDVAASCAAQPDADGLTVLADQQRKGRGRQGRSWLSPAGANLLASVLLLDRGSSAPAPSGLTLAAGLAVAEAVETLGPVSASLKWPNDVLLDGKKLAGILVEQRSVPAGQCVVIGVGVNVNAHPPRAEVDRPATSLAAHLHEDQERIEVARAVLCRLDAWLTRLADAPAAAAEEIRRAWLARCGMVNERVVVLSRGRRIEGRVADIDPLGALVLLTDAGAPVHVPAEGASVL